MNYDSAESFLKEEIEGWESTNDVPDRDRIMAANALGLFAIAAAIRGLRQSIDRLGTNGDSTPLGAIEYLAMEVRDGLSKIASSFERDQ